MCVWTNFLHLNDFFFAVFFFHFFFFFCIKKSKKKWYACLHYYDNLKSCLTNYRVPDKVKGSVLCSDFFHYVLSISALLKGKNFILWMSLMVWDNLKNILFKEHTHTHTPHKSIQLWSVKKSSTQQTSVNHSRWNYPFWPKASCPGWTELA